MDGRHEWCSSCRVWRHCERGPLRVPYLCDDCEVMAELIEMQAKLVGQYGKDCNK